MSQQEEMDTSNLDDTMPKDSDIEDGEILEDSNEGQSSSTVVVEVGPENRHQIDGTNSIELEGEEAGQKSGGGGEGALGEVGAGGEGNPEEHSGTDSPGTKDFEEDHRESSTQIILLQLDPEFTKHFDKNLLPDLSNPLLERLQAKLEKRRVMTLRNSIDVAKLSAGLIMARNSLTVVEIEASLIDQNLDFMNKQIKSHQIIDAEADPSLGIESDDE